MSASAELNEYFLAKYLSLVAAMTSEVARPIIYGNFKPKRSERIKAKKSPADKRKKLPGNSEKHKQAIRTLPCCIPGCCVVGSEIHHLKSGGHRGAGMKAPDRLGVPLCHEHHINGVEKVGARNELAWFAKHGIEPLELAAALWMVSPDKAAMCRVVLAHKQHLSENNERSR